MIFMNTNNSTRNIKRIWRQSLDGRAMAAGGDANDGSLCSLQPAEVEGPRVRELEPFLQGCLSVLPGRLEKGRIRLGVFLFLLGVADRFWTLQGLDDRRFPSYAEGLLRRFGLSAPRAATLVSALPQLPGEASAQRALVQGGDALETWLRSRDPNVVLQLKELIAEWRRA